MARSAFKELYYAYGARNVVHHAIKRLRSKDHRSRRRFWREYLEHLRSHPMGRNPEESAERVLRTELGHFSQEVRDRWRRTLPDHL